MSNNSIEEIALCDNSSGINLPVKILVSIVFVGILIGTTVGNFLVILAVFIVKKLRTPSNLLIVSLAFSDLLVAILVLPFNIIDFLKGSWPFNESVCHLFISFDVLLCTASILNLCVISIDRYLVITKPMAYSIHRKNWLMWVYIFIAWSISGVITLPSTFHWKAKFKDCECTYSDDITYQIYATFCAFYIPLFIMLVLYGRIFKLARDITKADQRQKSFAVANSDNMYDQKLSTITENNQENCLIQSEIKNKESHSFLKIGGHKKKKSSNSETKAIKTLGIIMGGFCLCWLPFFIVQLVKALFTASTGNGKIDISGSVFRFLGWLGYLNSFLNPIIYAKFNQEFRLPFKMILMCKCRNINEKLRKKAYNEDFGLGNRMKRAKRDQSRN